MKDNSENKKKNRIFEICENVLFPFVLCLYPMRHVFIGIDFWDTGYNYANFRFMGTKHMDSMWLFSTYLANAVGHLFTYLPGGKTLLGLNLYTALTASTLALFSYFFLTKEIGLHKSFVFLGEMAALSLCFCPTALLYNYLTYLFLLLGVIFLYKGLAADRGLFLYLAGIFLGLNVFVRFSNLPQAALIVGVFAYAFICRKSIGKVLKETGLCVAGYISAAGLMLLYLSVRYGFSEYINGIKRLFAMTDTASDYKASSMITGMLFSYTEQFYWILRLGILCALSYMLFALIPAKWDRIRKTAVILVGALSVAWLIRREFATFCFSEYLSMYRPAVLFIMLCMAICLIQVFRRGASKEERLLGGLLFLTILITPIGSNTRLYAVINNLFLAVPYTFAMVERFLRYKWETKPLLGRTVSLFPLKTFVFFFILYFMFQASAFGTTFVFAEAKGIVNADTKAENNPVLKGVVMPADRAKELTAISSYVQENHLAGKELIIYGYIPAMSFYLDMPAAFNPWSDLASYQVWVMEEKMAKLKEEISEQKRENPVILLDRKYALFAEGGEAALQKEGYSEKEIADVLYDKKWNLILDFMNEQSYLPVFRGSRFTLYTKTQ